MRTATVAPHATVHGLGYSRRVYREGDSITDANDRRYVVTFVRDDGDQFGDGAACVEVYAEPASENLRICQG